MGIIRYKDVPYGGGGSSVTPNPSGTATANLEKVQIESTIYAIKDPNAVHSADKGVANGVASLDANGKVPSAQIPSLSSDYLPLAGGEMTGRIDTYAPPSDIMPAIMPKTEFYGSVGFSDKPYRFGFFQGMVLGATYGTGGTSVAKMGTLTMYTGLGAYAAVIKPDPSQSASEVDLVLPKASGTLALISEIPTKTSDLTNDSGFVTTDEKVTGEAVNPTSETVYDLLLIPHDSSTTNQKPKNNEFFKVFLKKGTTSVNGYNMLQLGNSYAVGAEYNQTGVLRIYGRKSGKVDLKADANSTSSREIYLPDADGTIALTSDLSSYLPLSGGEMTGRIDTYAPPSDIMPAIMPKTAFYGSVGFSNKPYRFGFFQGMVLGASYEEAGTSKMGTLTMYTGLGAYAAVIKPDLSQSVSEVDLTLPSASGTLARIEDLKPTPYSPATNVQIIKVGKMVILMAFGWNVSSYSNGWTNFITDAAYKPASAITFLGVIYSAENSNFIATCDINTDGKTWVRYKNTISARSSGISAKHVFWGTGCWFTS